MSKFKVGDEVEVVKDSSYSITKNGSKGVVLSVGKTSVYVEFYHLTTRYSESRPQFTIENKDLVLVCRKTNAERVLDKVALIHSRQQKRGIYAKQGRPCFL